MFLAGRTERPRRYARRCRKSLTLRIGHRPSRKQEQRTFSTGRAATFTSPQPVCITTRGASSTARAWSGTATPQDKTPPSIPSRSRRGQMREVPSPMAPPRVCRLAMRQRPRRPRRQRRRRRRGGAPLRTRERRRKSPWAASAAAADGRSRRRASRSGSRALSSPRQGLAAAVSGPAASSAALTATARETIVVARWRRARAG
ncbi:unnamed protein product, partial [Ectocarpus sp. 8 AP-2014]